MKSVVKLVVVLLLVSCVISRIMPVPVPVPVPIPIFNIPLNITAHVQNIGDISGYDNQWIGTKGQSLRL
jgi:hypothetical protein